MTDREAIKMALEALGKIHVGNMTPMAEENWNKALTALRQALAQEQEPKQTKCPRCGEVNPAEIHTCSPQVAQPEQEPDQQPESLESIEQYRMQMAGISTAAIGYWKESDSIHPNYDTVALRDVAKLYAKYDELHKNAKREPDYSDKTTQIKALLAIGGEWYDGAVRNTYIADTCYELTKIISRKSTPPKIAQPEQDHGFDRTASHMAGEYVDTAQLKAMHKACIEASMRNTQPEQEPVRWFQQFGDTPPKREWVGLTEGELIDIQNCNRGFWTNAAKIEQLLKDKNT